MARIAKIEKKFKDIERQNLIQDYMQNSKTSKEKCFEEPFQRAGTNQAKKRTPNWAELAVWVS